MKNDTGTADTPKRRGSDPVAVVLDGDCLQKTLRRLQMSSTAREALTLQAGELIGRVVEAYTDEYGPGEVGQGSSARTSARRARTEFGPTGLLYGRIQSGKTAAMITASAIAIDNGFRVVVVLTTNFVELVKQTKDRFDDLERALVHASTEPDAWTDDLKNIAKHVAARGLVVICAKDARHLERVSTLLDGISAGDYPGLILDDEADQASLDNNTRRRSRAENPEDVAPTKIHERIKGLRDQLRHHVFLQVTATPYALLLQNVDSPGRPRFAFLLEPGQGYTGGEHFFSEELVGGDDVVSARPPLHFVEEDESKEIDRGPAAAPSGLERAISYFLVAAAAQAVLNEDAHRESQNFLCHTSHRRSEHDKLSALIAQFLSGFEDELAERRGKAMQLVAWAYEDLRRTHGSLPTFDEVVGDITDRLPRRKIRVVNSEGKGSEERRGAPNFIVGGNIVGRGLTIPNLLVTYYLRKPQISQMDTMLQHARMFGYREKLMPFTRVFLPRSLALRFNRIHAAEADLRRMIPNVDALGAVPVQVVGELRATRYGVLDTSTVSAIRAGQHLFPNMPDYRAPSSRTSAIERILSRIYKEKTPATAVPLRPGETYEPVDMDTIIELFDAFSVSDDEWDAEAIRLLLLEYKRMGTGGHVKWRRIARGGANRELSTGAASGSEVAYARAHRGPTFFVFRQPEKYEVWDNKPFWYPSLVFPSSMPTYVYNRTSEEAS